MTAKRAAGLLEAGVWLQMAGDVDGARDVYRQALALEPDNARAKRLYVAAGGVLPEPRKSPPRSAATPHARHEPSEPAPPSRSELPVVARPSRGELPARQEPSRYEPSRYEPSRHEPSRHEPSRHEPSRYEPSTPAEATPARAAGRHDETPAPRSDETLAFPSRLPEPPVHAARDDAATVYLAPRHDEPALRGPPTEEEPAPPPRATPAPITGRVEPAPELVDTRPPVAAPVPSPSPPSPHEERGNEATRIISLAELELAVARTTPVPASKTEQVESLLKEAAACKAQGELDKASGLVLRALVLDGSNLDAHEAAYVLLNEQGRTQAAEAELVHFLKRCAQRGEVERARPYLLTLLRLRPNEPETLALAQQLGSASGDPNATLPATSDVGAPPPNRESSHTLNDESPVNRPGRGKRQGERPFGRRRR